MGARLGFISALGKLATAEFGVRWDGEAKKLLKEGLPLAMAIGDRMQGLIVRFSFLAGTARQTRR